MKIWVDGDACPKPVKEILFRAAERVKMPLKWVANQPLQAPPSRYIETLRVGAGFDVADNAILQSLVPGDLVITADIPLAAAAIDEGALALSPRGTLYTPENIQESLAMRNFMDELRSSGVKTGGPGTFSQADRHAFAQQLDKVLAASQRGT